MLMLEAAEKHRIENMLKSTENSRAPAQLSDAGLTCLVEMRLKSKTKAVQIKICAFNTCCNSNTKDISRV